MDDIHVPEIIELFEDIRVGWAYMKGMCPQNCEHTFLTYCATGSRSVH